MAIAPPLALPTVPTVQPLDSATIGAATPPPSPGLEPGLPAMLTPCAPLLPSAVPPAPAAERPASAAPGVPAPPPLLPALALLPAAAPALPAAPAPAPAPPPAAEPATPPLPPLPAAGAGPPLLPAAGAAPMPQESIGTVVRATLHAGNVPLPLMGAVWRALHSGPGAQRPASSVQGVTSMSSFASIAATCMAMST